MAKERKQVEVSGLMILVLLSGNSANTREWIESVDAQLNDLFDSSFILYYEHWKTGGKMIDLDYELGKLAEFLKDKEYFIFAKSAGAVLALKGMSEKKIAPKKCLFTGLPLSWCREKDIPVGDWVEKFDIPTYFVQKERDPMAGAEDLRKFLNEGDVKNCRLIEIPGEDHHYEDLERLRVLMEELINENNL